MTDVLSSKKLPSVGPFDLDVILVDDPDTLPEDSECYSAEDIAAWENDDWHFVSAVVRVRLSSGHGDILASSYMGGMEYGDWTDGKFLDPLELDVNGYLPQMVEEAVEMAWEVVRSTVVAFQVAMKQAPSCYAI